MNTAQALQSSANTPQNGSVDSFARAMASTTEFEKSAGNSTELSALAQAFKNKNSGKQFNFPGDGQGNFSPDYFRQHQAELQEQQRQEKIRKHLRDEVNSQRNYEIFHAREKQVKEQIEQLKAQLIPAAKQVEEAQPQVFTPLHEEVAQPGLTGKGLVAYFEGLGGRIKEYTKNVKDSNVWLQGLTKKRQGLRAGNVTANVQNTMHHEKSVSATGAG